MLISAFCPQSSPKLPWNLPPITKQGQHKYQNKAFRGLCRITSFMIFCPPLLGPLSGFALNEKYDDVSFGTRTKIKTSSILFILSPRNMQSSPSDFRGCLWRLFPPAAWFLGKHIRNKKHENEQVAHRQIIAVGLIIFL